MINLIVFYPAFDIISVIPLRNFTSSCALLSFTSTKLRLSTVVRKDTPTEKPRGCSATRTWGHPVTGHTHDDHEATHEPQKTMADYLLAVKRGQWYISRALFNPLPVMPILGSSNSAANKDLMTKIGTNGDTITSFCLSRKHCGKRRNCSLRAISTFPTMFSKAVCG